MKAMVERALTLFLCGVTISLSLAVLWFYNTLAFIGLHSVLRDPGSILICLSPFLPLFGSAWCARNALPKIPRGSSRRLIGTFLLLFSLLVLPPLFVISFFPRAFVIVGFMGMPRPYSYPSLLARVEGTAVWLLELLIPLMSGLLGAWLLQSRPLPPDISET